MAKKGMKRPSEHRTNHDEKDKNKVMTKNDVEPVPEIQGKQKTGK